jgi:hypothetical protein
MKTYWFKEPWAWLVVLLPLCAVVASVTTYFIANDTTDSLVIGDYYKKGKAINQDISKIKQAQKLGIKFQLQLIDQQLVIKPNGIEKQFPVLIVNFFHPTLQKKDFSLKLTQDANGLFRQTLPKTIKGKWRVTISSFENNWKIHQVIYLPSKKFIDIIPDIQSAI